MAALVQCAGQTREEDVGEGAQVCMLQGHPPAVKRGGGHASAPWAYSPSAEIAESHTHGKAAVGPGDPRHKQWGRGRPSPPPHKHSRPP